MSHQADRSLTQQSYRLANALDMGLGEPPIERQAAVERVEKARIRRRHASKSDRQAAVAAWRELISYVNVKRSRPAREYGAHSSRRPIAVRRIPTAASQARLSGEQESPSDSTPAVRHPGHERQMRTTTPLR